MCRGDMRYFEIIVHRYSARVFALVVGIVRSRERAEEIVSDVFFKVYDKIGDFKARSSFSTWLYRIAYNAAISDARKKDMLSKCPVADIAAESVADDDSQWELKEENIRKMEAAVEMLSAQDRTLVRLYYWDDKSVSEISDITGMSQSGVKTKLFRIRATLKSMLKNV